MNKTILKSGVFMGLLAVLLGAFGAHGLEGQISGNALEIFETGVEFQMYHALLLLILGNMNSIPAEGKSWVFRFILVGIIFFSFSLYLLALDSLWDMGFARLGLLTPLGGILLITGWILLAYRLFKPLNQTIH
jgi:uncharacterized membrane protein YgdD (TMEM256/DUF423 family)